MGPAGPGSIRRLDIPGRAPPDDPGARRTPAGNPTLRLLFDIMRPSDHVAEALLQAIAAEDNAKTSALEPLALTTALKQIRRAMAASACGWGWYDLRAQQGMIKQAVTLVGGRNQPDRQSAPRIVKWLRNIKTGAIMLPGPIVNPGSIWVRTNSPTGGDGVAQPLKLPDSASTVFGVIAKHEPRIEYLFAVRSIRGRNMHGSNGSGDLLVFHIIVDWLKRTLDDKRAAEKLRTSGKCMEAALDRLAVGVAFVTRSREPLVLNRSARDLLAERDGLAIGPDGLCATLNQETAELRRLIADVGAGKTKGGAMKITRSARPRPLIVIVFALPSESLQPRPDQLVAGLFLCDSWPRATAAAVELRHLYGLTAAEANLAVMLAQGARLLDAAVELGISPDTARTHLKRIFSKTDTTGQIDLLQLLLSHLAVSHGGPPRA